MGQSFLPRWKQDPGSRFGWWTLLYRVVILVGEPLRILLCIKPTFNMLGTVSAKSQLANQTIPLMLWGEALRDP